VTKRGVAWTAANVDHRWIGTNAQALLSADRTAGGLPERRDAAGVAEMALGAGGAVTARSWY
jgi:polyphosphate glucokinase